MFYLQIVVIINIIILLYVYSIFKQIACICTPNKHNGFLHEDDHTDEHYDTKKDSFYKFSVIKMIFFMREVTQ